MARHTVADITVADLRTVNSDTTITEVIEQMFETGSPQLGVEANDELVGIVSHRDFTRVLHLCGQIKQEDSVLEKSITMAVNRSYGLVEPENSLFKLFDHPSLPMEILLLDQTTGEQIILFRAHCV